MRFSDYLKKVLTLYADADVAPELQPSATLAEITALEQDFGFPLPEELKQAWLAANGGGYYKALFARPGYLTGYDFLSLSDCMDERMSMKNRAVQYLDYQQEEARDARISPNWYEPGWLPFASFGGGTLLLILDMSPRAQGKAGQIICFTHDPDCMEYVAASFNDLLVASLKMFEEEADELIYED
ncbi:SMI1/KNR4 family protein [Undibacterium pigrum]|uniref:Cell wall assembly regulator SMI1 n=1 Tax=Undibacterium pigrum TaxID=401470 RepID=A0A318JAK4_9BURK|nr:SMI1/KNR4 family protein [Undibacterium pigrum]PXX45148.1 cell wall assembly regulator SMI1 [Undibacterium pigrum]